MGSSPPGAVLLVWVGSLRAAPGPRLEQQQTFCKAPRDVGTAPGLQPRASGVARPPVTWLSSLLYRLTEDKLVAFERTTAECH